MSDISVARTFACVRSQYGLGLSTDDTLSDALTKGLDAAGIQKHLEVVGIDVRPDRHRLASTLDGNDEGTETKSEDERRSLEDGGANDELSQPMGWEETLTLEQMNMTVSRWKGSPIHSLG